MSLEKEFHKVKSSVKAGTAFSLLSWWDVISEGRNRPSGCVPAGHRGYDGLAWAQSPDSLDLVYGAPSC